MGAHVQQAARTMLVRSVMIDKRLLEGKWLHAHEEDRGGRTTLRPASHALPPARGRVGYEFHPDGRLSCWRPGSTDRTEQATGTWRLDPDGRIEIRLPGKATTTMGVVTADADRLVLCSNDEEEEV